jgi:hypothetical protein
MPDAGGRGSYAKDRHQPRLGQGLQATFQR